MTKKKAKEVRKRGRPPFVWTKEIEDEIIRRVENGDTVAQIYGKNGIPNFDTMRLWRVQNQDFSERYARAREVSAEALEQQIIAEAAKANDKDSAAAARVRVDALKWIASKRNPRQYGDRLQVDAKVADVTERTDADVESRIAAILGKAGIAGAAGGTATPEAAAKD